MSPREALLMIPGFAHARVLGQLADGPASASWLVENAEGRFVLRVDTPQTKDLGLDRAAETEVQAAVAQAGLTPPVVFSAPDRGVSLRPHLEGRAWTAADLDSDTNLKRVAALLGKLHALPPVGPRFEPGRAIRRYADSMGTPDARKRADEANVLLAELRDPPPRECLCHNDPVAGNLIDDGEHLWPIDWEFAGIGDPMFDLAVVMEHHGLAPSLREGLLHAYLCREPRHTEVLRMNAWCHFYRILLHVWNRRIGLPG
ncbi:choline/ethanolamine kinase family protein [Elongatibacter sediminis]|uniref:Choline/ethanolamine kinase family protein n=1 Tax=Elongatibacter sediminis TaxID=3119006 RepID=A0AAW9R8M1_9GAMM